MTGVKRRPLKIDFAPPFFDDEGRELIESFEDALERGDVAANSPEELAKIDAEWKAIAEASRSRESALRETN